jgi:nanoRNase/pAp phosphatase (c-di-AMP/oligoRNAs hydrolase)
MKNSHKSRSEEADISSTTRQELEEISQEQVIRAVRRMSNIERLKAFLHIFRREDRVLIVIVADPDSMSSAFAVKRILSRRVSEITIAHPNTIQRINNIAMRNLLKIPMQPLRGTKKDEYTKLVLLDSQPTHHPDLGSMEFDVVIDHHPVSPGWSAPFIDIRTEYGAVATMITEYLKAAKIKPNMAIATALFYGIKVDTQNFTKKATQTDIFIFQYLFKLINQYWLQKIEISDIRKSELRFFKIALQEMKTSKKRIYTHVGRVHNPDILVVLADFMSHVHDIGWVFVSGFHNDKLIVIFRCDGYKKDAGKLADKVFGKRGSAGGHAQAARAEIPLKDIPEVDMPTFDSGALQRLFVKHIS